VENLVLGKRERVTMRGIDRDDIRSEIDKVAEMVADVPTTDSLGKRHGEFRGWQLEKWRYAGSYRA
jgi:hypothetical protein